MKLPPLPKLKESRLSQIWFSTLKVIQLSWQINPTLLVVTLLTNTVIGLFIYPMLRLEKLFIDTLIGSIGTDFWGQSAKILISILFLRFLVALGQDLFSKLSAFLSRIMSRIFSAYITVLIAKKNAELDISTLENPNFKDKFNKIQREASHRAWHMMVPFSELPMYIAGIASTLFLITSFNPAISVVILLLSIPEFLIDARYIKREYRFEDEVSPKYRVWGWLEHYLLTPRNILEIKLLGLAGLFTKRMFRLQNEIFSQRIKIEKGKTISYIFASFPQSVFLFLAGIYLTFLVVVARITVGSAEMLLRAMNSFRANLTGLVRNFLQFYENYLYVADLVWLLELKPALAVTKRGEKIPLRLKKGIEFKNVWFRYTDDDHWVLKDIDLRIDPEENIAIIGENGAGKSTLVKLICRFYDPQKGKIFLNGIDLKRYSMESLWHNLSVLFQDFETYPFTAKESIAYGDITKIKNSTLVKKAAKKAEIDEFIESLPLKYKNPLDPAFEKGIRPSFGQWQRIGLARVFLKDSRIIILDEPTSSVDPKAEEQIFRKIITHSKRKILILISHRFSTVRQADKIYVLDKGEIIEGGTHQELMEKKGMYAELFELQAKSYR